MIYLNKSNINKIKYEDIIAIFVAEGGAMGEPNAFHVVLKGLIHYYANLGNADFSKEEFDTAFPVMKTFRCFAEEVNKLEEGWNWFNAGFGNYLIVRNDYYEKIKKTIEKNLTKDYTRGELYNHWYEMIEKGV